MHVLVIGATGYVGARLVPRLLADGHTVRCLVRDPAKCPRDWAGRVEAVPGDATDPAATRAAVGDIDSVDAAVHLVHSMDSASAASGGFADRDRRAAQVLAAAAEAAGVRRIVYLSGLQPSAGDGSPHLASRREVGEVFLGCGVPAAVLQAGVVVGAGSVSFELIRRTAEAAAVLPVALTPDRAWNRVQPIAVDDVLHFLAAALTLPADVDRSFDVGGPDVLTYQQLATEYARVAGLRRPVVLPVPLALPRLTARLLEAVTPFDRRLTGPLLASTAYDLVCREHDLADRVGPPAGGPTPYAEAVARALRLSPAPPRTAPAAG